MAQWFQGKLPALQQFAKSRMSMGKIVMAHIRSLVWAAWTLLAVLSGPPALAAVEPAERTDAVLHVVTVERQPFAMSQDGALTGFSVDLFAALAERLGWQYELVATPSFKQMLNAVAAGDADLAIGNISITSARELQFDFSHPVFDAGLQILVPEDATSNGVLRAIFTWEMAAWIASAVAVIFVLANLMWLFERRHSPYFQRRYREGMWPSFWYTLQVMINGGFEEHVPRTLPARLLGIALVLCSLFVVSAFVAKISSTMTVHELRSDIESYSDLYGKRVGTTRGSTAAAFLESQSIKHQTFDDIGAMFDALTNGKLDAVVHDAPVLRYFSATRGRGHARVVGQIFKPEKYGILFPQGSARVETLNRALLSLREDGSYHRIYTRWFGASARDQ